MWKYFCSLNPNYSDYFRNSAWSISSSILVTLGLKFESWDGIPLLFLTLGFIFFVFAALCLTILGNFIKKYQTKHSDLKLITRTKNDFKNVGTNFYNDLHKHLSTNTVKDYPSFLELDQYLDNVSQSGKESEKNYPQKLWLSILFVFFGILFTVLSGLFSKKVDNSSKEFNKTILNKVDSITISIRKNDSLNSIYFDSLKIHIDSTATKCKKTKSSK